MKKVISFILMLSLLQLIPFVLDSCENRVEEAVKTLDSEGITYLVCGFDDAAENTDSIILANYGYSTNVISFLQIPRDTYFKGAPYSKINSIYSSERAKGRTQAEAMLSLVDQISDNMGIIIDAYMGYTTSAFSRLLDCIGGVTVDLPTAFDIKDGSGNTVLSLEKGKNFLNGQQSLIFVRSRNSYVREDIGRVDAQKFFLSALAERVKRGFGIWDLVNMCTKAGDGWITNGKISDIFKIFSSSKGRIKNIGTNYTTIPGGVARSGDGVWYYSLSKTPTVNVLKTLGFRREGDFDKKNVFLNDKNKEFVNIYNNNIPAKVYDDNSLRELDIKIK